MPSSALLLMTALLVGLLPATTQAQQTDHLERVREAFERGDAHALLDGQAAHRVEVTLLGRSTLYSRAQATYVLNDFFHSYPPEQFLLRDVSETTSTRSAAGQYWSQQAQHPFRVYLRFRAQNDTWQLREIQIEQRE